MVFTVEQRIDGVVNTKMLPVSAISQTERGEADFGEWFDDEHTTYNGVLAMGANLPSATHRFEVICAGRRKVSADLPYADFVDVTHVFHDTMVPLAKVPFVLRTPWASRPGETDGNGRIRVDQLPPGGALIDFGHFYLLDSFPTPVDGGDPVISEPAQTISLRLLDHDFAPRAGVEYYVGDFPSDCLGETDADGLIEATVPASLTSLTLIYDEGEHELQVSPLPPITEISGVQQRLKNLGYDAGPNDGTLNPQTEHAILEFRRKRGLGDPTAGASVLDSSTRNSLQAAHGY